jgi:predicted small lipoprotein YifL
MIRACVRCGSARSRDTDEGRGYTAAMTKRLAFALLLLCVLAGCGNKGPLVMPDPPAQPAVSPAASPAAADAPATEATPVPATPVPATPASGTPAAQH